MGFKDKAKEVGEKIKDAASDLKDKAVSAFDDKDAEQDGSQYGDKAEDNAKAGVSKGASSGKTVSTGADGAEPAQVSGQGGGAIYIDNEKPGFGKKDKDGDDDKGTVKRISEEEAAELAEGNPDIKSGREAGDNNDPGAKDVMPDTLGNSIGRASGSYGDFASTTTAPIGPNSK